MLRLFDRENRDITDECEFCDNPACLGEPWCSAWGICKAMEPKESASVDSHGDTYFDNLFNDLSQQMDSSSTFLQESTSSTSLHCTRVHIPQQEEQPCSSTSLTSFTQAKPTKQRPSSRVKSDKEVEQARASGIPPSTQKDTKYCIGLWNAWVSYRALENGDVIKPIGELSREELDYWLTRFILEVKHGLDNNYIMCNQNFFPF